MSVPSGGVIRFRRARRAGSAFAAGLILLAGLGGCHPPEKIRYVDLKNPFLTSTVESFRLSAREAMADNNISALANHVFLLKRSLPVAWVAVVDSSGTVLMHSDPRAIATTPGDAASAQSLAHADHDRPLVRRLWSADRRPVLDFTLPVAAATEQRPAPTGYVRIAFYAGSRAPNWVPAGQGRPQ